MSLSEQEQRALREIEQSLLAEDPSFGASAENHDGMPHVTLRGVAVLVIGLLMLLGGVVVAAQSLWFVALSVAGFVVMFLSGVWMLRGDSHARASSRTLGSSRATKNAQNSRGGKSSAGDRLEESFRRRFEEK